MVNRPNYTLKLTLKFTPKFIKENEPKNAIKKLSVKLGESSGNYLTAIACVEKLKIAWKEYQAAKKEAAALRRAFLEDQIARKAHDKKMSSEDMVKMLRKEQRAIQEGYDLQQIRGEK